MLHTPLCDLLGIEVPVLQAGMGMGARARLAGAVSAAGGLGVLGAAGLTPEEIGEELREVRRHTDRPVGVDLLFPAELVAGGVADALDEFLASAPPQARADLAELARLAAPGWVDAQVDAAMAGGASVVVSGLGSPAAVVDRCRAAGTRVLALAGTPAQAARLEADGVDAVIASGSDAGGHTGRVGSLSLWTAVVERAGIPVIAAGGIVDGRGLAAAIALGCVGAWIGTRFVATPEAEVHEAAKARLLAAGTTDTVVTRAYTGKPMRVVRNRFTDEWEGRATLPFPLQLGATGGLGRRGMEDGDVEEGAVQAGQGVGLVGAAEPAADLVHRIAEEAAAHLRRAARATE